MSQNRYFNDDARNLWRKVVAIMDDRRTISPDNAPLLEFYCVEYAAWQSAQRELRANGGEYVTSKNGFTVQHAAVALAKQHREAVEKLAGKLGLTPQMPETIDPVRQLDEKASSAHFLDRDPNAPIDFSTALRPNT